MEDSQIEVHVLSIQTKGFVYPHSGHGQQTEKRRKRVGAKSP
jgi:hypothetical protein